MSERKVRKVPTEPGLWLRKEPAMLLAGVNIRANVSVYDGPRLPLGWYSERSQTWEEPRDDGFWIREVREDDVPASVVEALWAERDRYREAVWRLRVTMEGAAAQLDAANAEIERLRALVEAAYGEGFDDGCEANGSLWRGGAATWWPKSRSHSAVMPDEVTP